VENTVVCNLRYFNANGQMFSSYTELILKNMSFVDAVVEIKERWRNESLPNLVKRYYPRYIHAEMHYGEDSAHDDVFLLDFTEGLQAKKWLDGYEPVKKSSYIFE
jgi:hypothetical protein